MDSIRLKTKELLTYHTNLATTATRYVADAYCPIGAKITYFRNKSKKLAAACKNASKTIKAKSGLNQFQDENEYRKWFTILFPLIESRASAQADRQLNYSLVIRQQAMKW